MDPEEPTREPQVEETTRLAHSPAATSGRPRLFRVFVSSTFEDLEAERNVLVEQVYPELSRFCAKRGARFQPIDLRWGVSEEASVDQQAMSICLAEIERCREVTPRPNFLILLGNRYGSRPLPPTIPRAEFLEIFARVPDGKDRQLLEKWYQLDENAVPVEGAVPGEYRLQPRSGKWAPVDHEAGLEGESGEEPRRWERVERRLRTILTTAVASMELQPERRGVYETSATEQEIRAGALGIGGPEDRAFCFTREISLTDENPDPRHAAPTHPIRRFVDPGEVGPPEGRDGPLTALKRELANAIPVTRYDVGWSNENNAPTTGHLEQLASDVLATLEGAVTKELEHPSEPVTEEGDIRIMPDSQLDVEGHAHREFADERIRFFVGRHEILDSAAKYLDEADLFPLVVHGEGGTGKSALLAKIVQRAQDRGDAQLVFRFIGATPGSTSGRSLLEGICRELARRYGADESDVPSDFNELSADLRERLGSATAERPLLLLIDSLDQLGPGDGARRLTWIPELLPEHVRLVVSTRPGETLDPLRLRLQRLESADSRLLEVGAMPREDGDELLRRWLADAHRGLTDVQRQSVLDAFVAASGNPLYLRLAFEEARRWISEQDPEELAIGEIEDGHQARDVEAIIEKNTFARIANESNHGKVLVSHALGYLAGSRYGLAEDELLDLLSRDPDVYSSFVLGSHHVPSDLRARLDEYFGTEVKGDPRRRTDEWVREIHDGDRGEHELRDFLAQVLPRGDKGLRLPVVLWSRLHADLRPYLSERSAEGAILIAFFHHELDNVAKKTYLTDDAGLTMHSRLADYFRTKADPNDDHTWTTDGESVDRRGLSELPYHLTHAERWDDVHDTLTDFVFLEQKLGHVGVTARAEGDEEPTIYRGAFQLQDDFDAVLQLMPGDEGDSPGRRRVIVTAVDLGEGLVIRCPHCNEVHKHRKDWKDQDIDCPDPDCKGPLRVNPFVVERSAS